MKEIALVRPPSSITIVNAWVHVIREPSLFIRHWNYKGAVLSGGLRAPIFLITYLLGRESIKLALAAAFVQFAFRFLFAGVSGAMIQSFRRVEPAWTAMVSILLVVPLISHILEYFLQVAFAYVTATTDYSVQAIVRSVCVSMISVLFALYIMRRDVMIVGETESKSLWSDITQLPILIYEFVMFIPNEIAAMLRRHAYFYALLSFAAFGLFSEMIVWGVTNKIFWTYGGGHQIEGIRFWGIDGIIIMAAAVVFSFIFVHRREPEKINKS